MLRGIFRTGALGQHRSLRGHELQSNVLPRYIRVVPSEPTSDCRYSRVSRSENQPYIALIASELGLEELGHSADNVRIAQTLVDSFNENKDSHVPQK
jgi:hypothetical protein